MNKNDLHFQFVKMAIDKVKQYAQEHTCTIDEACGPVTGVSRTAYDDAVQLMIRTGNRYHLYNKVQVLWNDLDVVNNYGIRMRYPHLYKELVYPDLTVKEYTIQGHLYCLSDEAYDEWVHYQKEQTCPEN